MELSYNQWMAQKGRNAKRDLLQQKKQLNASFNSAMSADKMKTIKAVNAEVKR